MRYDEWLKKVPDFITSDRLWSVKAYRLALYLGDVAWQDASKAEKDVRTKGIAGQLYRAVGSIGANIAEGYSRSSSRDKARFYEYALGSAREARDWYYKAKYVIGHEETEKRLRILAEIMRLLIAMILQQRGSREIRELSAEYHIEATDAE